MFQSGSRCRGLWTWLTLVVLFALLASTVVQAQARTTIEVFFRPNPGDMPILEAIKAAFEEAHPDIEIQYLTAPFGEYWEKIPVLYASGNAPDVIFPSTAKAVEYALAGMLLPLDDFIEADGLDLSDYVQPVLAHYRIDGRQYALPNDVAAMAYVYNANMFAESGLEPPQLGWSGEEYREALRKLTIREADGRVSRFGSAWPNVNLLIWSGLGSNFFDDELWPSEFRLNTPRGHEVLQFIQDLAYVDHTIPQAGESGDLLTGTAAMGVYGHWNLPNIIQSASFDWNLTSLPVLNVPVQRGDGSGWSIMNTTTKAEAAWKFVKFIAGQQGQLVFAQQQFATPVLYSVANSPVWRDVPGRPHVEKDAFFFGLENPFNNSILTHPRAGEFMGLVNQALRRIWENGASPGVALDAIAGPIDRLLAEIVESRG